jgi:anti-sigma B factor antagonist
MEFATRTDERLQIVSVKEPRIDAAVAIEFKDAMRAQTEGGPGIVVLDLSEVEFIDSSGLGAIVASMKTMGKEKTLALAGLTPSVARVFQLTRMDSVFRLFPTLDGALAEFRPH